MQLPEFDALVTKSNGAENWPVIREKQAQVASEVPGAFLVITLGEGDPKLLHPRNKQEVGQRAAWRALNVVYQQKISSVPVVEKVEWSDSAVEIAFSGAADGLQMKEGGNPAFELASERGGKSPDGASLCLAELPGRIAL